MGSELSCTTGKRGGGDEGPGGESERTPFSPPFPLLSPLAFVFFVNFFSGALLSERLEQAIHRPNERPSVRTTGKPMFTLTLSR